MLSTIVEIFFEYAQPNTSVDRSSLTVPKIKWGWSGNTCCLNQVVWETEGPFAVKVVGSKSCLHGWKWLAHHPALSWSLRKGSESMCVCCVCVSVCLCGCLRGLRRSWPEKLMRKIIIEGFRDRVLAGYWGWKERPSMMCRTENLRFPERFTECFTSERGWVRRPLWKQPVLALTVLFLLYFLLYYSVFAYLSQMSHCLQNIIHREDAGRQSWPWQVHRMREREGQVCLYHRERAPGWVVGPVAELAAPKGRSRARAAGGAPLRRGSICPHMPSPGVSPSPSSGYKHAGSYPDLGIPFLS